MKKTGIIQTVQKVVAFLMKKKDDVIQIALNIVAFLILYTAPGGIGSFWGFLTFNIISAIILFEIIMSEDRTAMWVWITKVCTYIPLTIKFSHTMGLIRNEYICMILISAIAVLISRRFMKGKRRALAMWGQNIAYIIGAYMYIMAIYHNPDAFGNAHKAFWLCNTVSYGLLIREIVRKKKDRVNLIIPVYAFIMSIIYIVLMMAFQQGTS